MSRCVQTFDWYFTQKYTFGMSSFADVGIILHTGYYFNELCLQTGPHLVGPDRTKS